MRNVLLSTVMFFLGAGSAFAAPGDLFGGDDTGCVPGDSTEYRCETVVARALAKLATRVTVCHITQASAAFNHKPPGTPPGFGIAEENCEEGNSSTSAKSKFDAAIAKYASVCAPELIANANTQRDRILTGPDSLDARNANVYCDATRNEEIDPGGDDTGLIPATDANLACANRVARYLAR